MCEFVREISEKNSENEGKKRAKIINDARYMRLTCGVCSRMKMLNVANRCEDCTIRESSNNENKDNEENVNEAVDASR